MYSQFFVLSLRGDTVFLRDFRRDFADTQSTQLFFQNIQSDTPVFNIDGVQYIYIRNETMYFVLNTRENVSPFVSFELLERIVLVFTDFCGVMSEGVIRKNILLLNELVDEMIDFGYVQETGLEPLVSLSINKPVLPSENLTIVKNKPPTNENLSVAVPLPQGMMFMNLFEDIEVLFDGTGSVRKAHLEGQLVIRNFSNCNPKLQISFNNDFTIGRTNDIASQGKTLDYCTFNDCVNFSKWDSQRMLEIAKCPSGSFSLLKYLVIDDFKKPFTFSTLVEEGPFDGQLELVIKITSHLEEGMVAKDVLLSCPIPKSTLTVNFSVGDPQGQECEYDKTNKTVKWRILAMKKGMEFSIRVKLNLGTDQEKGNHKRELGPLSLSFEIHNHVYANVSIKSIVIDDSTQPKQKEPIQKFMKMKTKSVSYESRVDFSHSNRSRVK